MDNIEEDFQNPDLYDHEEEPDNRIVRSFTLSADQSSKWGLMLAEFLGRKRNRWTEDDHVKRDVIGFLVESIQKLNDDFIFEPWHYHIDHKNGTEYDVGGIYEPDEDGTFTIGVYEVINSNYEPCSEDVLNLFRDAFMDMISKPFPEANPYDDDDDYIPIPK